MVNEAGVLWTEGTGERAIDEGFGNLESQRVSRGDLLTAENAGAFAESAEKG